MHFLRADKHRADVAGFAGDPVVRTPVLDEVARTAALFTHVYALSPIRTPAVQSLAAGAFPRTTGCERYGEELRPGPMTFARRFALCGYQTVACGKLHHTGMTRCRADCAAAAETSPWTPTW
ncbi:sulfatase-like hydrolase/transferase [Streptomyces sp. NPDC051956]|uniref:sulfatase-like hydrolase/transferase n=1 Tax=Streptomyces sp. NPDC051956 TaxID=3365677 RepID=UPI0037D06ACA